MENENDSQIENETELKHEIRRQNRMIDSLRQRLQVYETVDECPLPSHFAVNDNTDNTDIETLANRVQQLEDELKKVSVDRDHFRHLASQKHKIVEETDDKKLYNQLTCERDKLQSDCERLRQHLIAVEESYTQELLTAEEREKELRNRLATVEDETTLKEQIMTLQTQRDSALNEVSVLEDKVQQFSASISNLQFVIQQLQKDNERKLKHEEMRHREEVAYERTRIEELMSKLKATDDKYAETIEAIEAASRLSETIDLKEQSINAFKNELNVKDEHILALNRQIAELKQNFEGKVDKCVMKNLVLGFFTAQNDKRDDVKRLLSRILDFNEHEMKRADIPMGSIKFGSSLSRQFVQFLEQESKPSTIVANQVTRDLSKTLTDHVNPFLASPVTQQSSSHTNQLLSGITQFQTGVSVSLPDDFITKADHLNLI